MAMNARIAIGVITMLAIAGALSACGPANAPVTSPAASTEPSLSIPADEPLNSNPEAPRMVTGREPDLREQVDAAMRVFEVSGVRIYSRVANDFPEEFATMVDATTAALQGDQTDRDSGLAGRNFAMSLKQKYADRIKDAGPQKVRELLVARRDLFLTLQRVYGAEACNEMVRADAFADDAITRVGDVFVPYMFVTWSAMKAGVAAPRPQANPTRQDILALASAAIKAGGPKAAIESWANGKVDARGQECELLVSLLDAEMAMPGEAGERLMAASTISLPSTTP